MHNPPDTNFEGDHMFKLNGNHKSHALPRYSLTSSRIMGECATSVVYLTTLTTPFRTGFNVIRVPENQNTKE